MFATITRDGKMYQRTVPSHPICKQLKEVYEETARPTRGRPKKANNNRELSDISSSETETESDQESIQITRTRAPKRKVTESATKVTEPEQEPIRIPRTRTTRFQTQ